MQGLKSEPNYKRLVLASSGALNCLKVEMEHKETSESSVNQVFDALKHIEEFQQLLIRAQTERQKSFWMIGFDFCLGMKPQKRFLV